jgi:hypothetical protein
MDIKECEVCSSAGRISFAEDVGHVYQENGKSQSIDLCYYHSVELFKIGQLKFIMKHGFKDLTKAAASGKPGSGFYSYLSFK